MIAVTHFGLTVLQSSAWRAIDFLAQMSLQVPYQLPLRLLLLRSIFVLSIVCLY